ncbi:hypothetical protein LJC74_09510, partial [Eubacteriales bacterium OttesenSCG-928-A19]|nr:hypothetical protein [Eubacteriales bacterium OttesenSCG-928-A19]
LMLIREERPVAYCCAERNEDGEALITEIAAAPQAERLLAGLVREAAVRLGCARIRTLAPLLPELVGEPVIEPQYMMVRLNLPLEGIPDSDALVASMLHAGICKVDDF